MLDDTAGPWGPKLKSSFPPPSPQSNLKDWKKPPPKPLPRGSKSCLEDTQQIPHSAGPTVQAVSFYVLGEAVSPLSPPPRRWDSQGTDLTPSWLSRDVQTPLIPSVGIQAFCDLPCDTLMGKAIPCPRWISSCFAFWTSKRVSPPLGSSP